jgi:hypothetical protein
MEALMQPSIASPQERGIPGSAGLVAPQDGPSAARYRSAALQSAVRLLGEAGRALRDNRDVADARIAKAAALLQAESDLADIRIGGAGAVWSVVAPRRWACSGSWTLRAPSPPTPISSSALRFLR